MSAFIPSRTPQRSHPHNRTYARAWRLAAALAPSGAQAARRYPAALVALGVSLLGVTLALPPVGVLLEVLAYLHWLDTSVYTVPLVRDSFPAPRGASVPAHHARERGRQRPQCRRGRSVARVCPHPGRRVLHRRAGLTPARGIYHPSITLSISARSSHWCWSCHI